ncbi:hypothetical protein T484DRAFT_1825592, partial [Baffinella frigidus]
VRELSFQDERYLRLEERVEELTRDKAGLLDRCEDSEALLSSVLTLNQALVPQKMACEEKLGQARLGELRAKSECESALFLVATLQARVAQLESLVLHAASLLPRDSTDAEGVTEAAGAGGGADATAPQQDAGSAEARVRAWLAALRPTAAPGGRPSSPHTRTTGGGGGAGKEVDDEEEEDEEDGEEEEVARAETLEVNLRVSERHVEALAEANRSMFRALMAALLANGPDGTARAPGMDERGEGYARGDASVYNEMMTPKVGPGSRNEKRPLWLFKETGVTDMARELDGVKGQRGPGGAREKAGFAELSNEGIAQWLQEFRIRMNKSSVRFLASQDCTVLGAELYTKVAFDKLLKRA